MASEFLRLWMQKRVTATMPLEKEQAVPPVPRKGEEEYTLKFRIAGTFIIFTTTSIGMHY